MGAPSAWISLVRLRPRRAGLRFSRPGDLTKAASDFQVPGDTRVMPRKSQRVRGTGPPKSPSVARGSWEAPLRRCNHLKRSVMMLNHSSNSPTDSREEPKFYLILPSIRGICVLSAVIHAASGTRKKVKIFQAVPLTLPSPPGGEG